MYLHRRLNLILLATCFLFILSKNVFADTASNYMWTGNVWGTGNSAEITYLQNAAQSGIVFSVYSWEDTSRTIEIFPANDTNLQRTLTIWADPYEADVTKTWAISRSTQGYSTDTLTLGGSPTFGFSFTDQNGTYFNYLLSGNAETGWDITSVGTTSTMKIHISGNGISSVSPVPIPGAAVLLGSGLLGLVGIGSRKKKSVMPVVA